MQLASAAPTAVRRALRRALSELGYAPAGARFTRRAPLRAFRSMFSRSPVHSHHRLVRALRRYSKNHSR